MNSLRVRLLISLLALVSVLAAVLGLVTYRNVLARTHELFDYQLRQMALSLRDQGSIAPEQASALADEDLDVVVQIWTVDGRTLYASRTHRQVPSRAFLGLADVRVGEVAWRTFSVASRDRIIQVAQRQQVREALAARAALRSIAPLAVLTPLMALAVWWLTAHTLRPLQRLAASVRLRDAQSLEPLPAAGLPDEVTPLVGALNALLARLEAALDTQRAFVSDAAHELRSPLTALKLQLQLLRRADDPAARAEALAGLGSGIDRAGRLVEQLLTLARTEPGAPRGALEPLDLVDVVREALVDTHAMARSLEVELALEGTSPVVIVGERGALASLVRNLLDNAVRHAPRGSRVDVRVDASPGGALLQIDDAGPGIPPADRARVFDRFVRRPGEGPDGTGLGLAIVRSVAERHGASVDLGDAPAGGLRVTVRFPRDPVAA